MTTFHKYVLIISAIVLIITISILIYTQSFSPRSKIFNVFQNTCPDGWNINENNKCSPPLNHLWAINKTSKNKNILEGKLIKREDLDNNRQIEITELDLSSGNPEWTKLYSGDTILCAKSRWANKNGFTWEGITNLGSSACK